MAAAFTETEAWGINGGATRGAASTAAKRDDDDRAKAREAARADKRAAQDAERHAFRMRRAEDDLSWRYTQGTADAFALAAQNADSGGGHAVYDNGDTESADAGRSFVDPALASTRQHLALREAAHRFSVRRWAHVEATLAKLGTADADTLAMAYTPHPRETVLGWPALRAAFGRRPIEVPVIENGRAVMRKVKRRAADMSLRSASGVEFAAEAGEAMLEDEEPLTTSMQTVSLVELAIDAKATRAGLATWLLKNGLSRDPDDERTQRQGFLEWTVAERHKDRAHANLFARIVAEVTARLEGALEAYVEAGKPPAREKGPDDLTLRVEALVAATMAKMAAESAEAEHP